MDYKSKADEFKELLESHKAVTVVSHIRPDGDSIGSALALFNSLKLSGKQVEIACADSDLPLKLDFLEGFGKYKKKIDYKDSLVVTLDCADITRVGFDLTRRDIVNIDHHKSNTNFGALNIVEIEVSTTAVLYKLLKSGFEINKNVAEALYAGLLTDSQNFTTTLVDVDTFKISSELLEYNLEPSYIAQMLNRRQSLSHIRLIARAIDSLRLYKNGKIALMVISQEDLKATGAKISDINGIIDYGISLTTVQIAILISDIKELVKVSLRSKDIDVSKIAIAFNGGGHKNVAGFETKNRDINSLKEKILKFIGSNICQD